ncbi:hypothetical protein JCM19045_2897 [Bacillus sp. JCM 19045]|uniref:YqzE family protein n=1 Tax=Shouchella xiaoxiensis TaxID=766895 RepID=A0ABS2SYK1_9BACI|nr:YqzE family protein [Shouchella xiaoxiensis]MBM7840335.1 hypothetical protein [Shouchella xiaoxiensis]GAF13640.1 hypothetical protein JCM19045_2897 [Bacillus sp. JCM 19045]
MSFQDLLKYATQEAVKQIDKPKPVRQAERERKKAAKEPLTHWAFGVMPFAFSFLKRRIKNSKDQ